MVKAIAYVRVSTDEQALHGVSVADQKERVAAYARLQGLELIETIVDEGVSGGKRLASRDGGLRLLIGMKREKVGAVIATKLDRIFRDASDALTVTRQWDKAGVALHLIDAGGQAINTASAMGRMFLSMMAAFAELERNLIAERTSNALAHKRAKAQRYCRHVYGFDVAGGSLVPNEGEQAALRTIHDWRAAGLSLRAIADKLNDGGIATKTGKVWYAATVKSVLETSAAGGESINAYRRA